MLPRILVLWFAFTPALYAQSPRPLLEEYVQKNDGAFSWKEVERTEQGGHAIITLRVISQRWQGEPWEHDVQIFLPKGVKPTATMVLYNDGGRVNPARTALGLAIAERANAPVAFVLGVPNQPLYGKREDALIAETFVKYLETRDPTWPLLFPMVKSVIRGMDAVQAFAKSEWQIDVTGFIVAGASKRGWTSWLTAATGDPRVKAIAPLVFDSLNLLEQMPNQVRSFGRFSEMIRDYEERKLLPLPETDAARELWAMVDPYAYRDKLTMPKLIVNGANDRYWAADALNYYWDDLKGPKFVLYVPNAGHDLRVMDDPGAERPRKDLFPMKAVDSLSAFCRCVVHDLPFPSVDAKAAEAGPAGLRLECAFTVPPKQVRTVVTSSDSRDFRKRKWIIENGPAAKEKVVIERNADAAFNAVFIEAEFEIEGQKFCLSTPIQIVEKK